MRALYVSSSPKEEGLFPNITSALVAFGANRQPELRGKRYFGENKLIIGLKLSRGKS
jgi:hypothetical protein